MFQTPHHVIVKPSLLLILMNLFTPQHWTLIKYDSPVSGNFAELGVTDALFPPYSIPLTAYVGLSLAQVAWSKVPSRSWVYRLDPSRPVFGCRQTVSTCVLDTLVSQLCTQPTQETSMKNNRKQSALTKNSGLPGERNKIGQAGRILSPDPPSEYRPSFPLGAGYENKCDQCDYQTR